MIHQLLWTQTDTCIFRIEIVQQNAVVLNGQEWLMGYNCQLFEYDLDINHQLVSIPTIMSLVHLESDEYRLRYTTNMSRSWVS